MATLNELSYSEHLGSLLAQWPEFLGLYELLSNPVSTGLEGGKALIIDQVKDGRIHARRFVNETVRLESALSRKPLDLSTRTVILQYTDANNVSAELVNVIATKHHINPVLLCSHFLDEENNASSYSHLQSHVPAFEFGFYNYLHASILFLPFHEPGKLGGWTTLVLLRTSATGCRSPAFELESPLYHNLGGLSSRISFSADLSERYITHLQSSTSTGHTTKTPLEMIYPVCQLIALEIKAHFHNSSKCWEKDRVISLLQIPEASTELRALDYDFTANLYRLSMDMDITAVQKTIATIANPSACSLPSHMALELRETILWQRLRQDLEDLREEIIRSRDKFEAYEARCLNRFNLAAASQSLQQSRSIGHLTTLAFIFIPMSFMTSFFGMNIAEFGSGEIHLRIFVLSTTAVLLIMLIAWALSGCIGKCITAISSNFYGLRIRLQTLARLAMISPTAAFWLACFAITHPPRVFQTFLFDVGVWAVLGLEMDWERPGLDEDVNLRRWRTMSPFWHRRGMEIVEMTRVRGWHRKVWYQRWREGRYTRTG